MDGTSYFPSRPEMEANLAAFAERADVDGPLRLPLDGDASGLDGRTATASSSRRPTASTAAGVFVVAVGVAEPYTPPGRRDGARCTTTPTSGRSRPTPDRRVLIIGKQNSGFELATGLLPWARQLVLVSPSKARLSVETQDAGRRPGPVRPAVRGPRAGRRRQRPGRGDRPGRARVGRRDRRSTCGGPTAAPTSRSRSTTSSPRPGSSRPLVDLPELGRRDVRGQPAAGPDALVGERDRARDLLRRHDRPGFEGPPEARRAVELGGRPRRALQRPGPGRAHRPDAASGSSRTGRPSRRTRWPASWRPSWPRRPSSSISAATSPVS